jgi:uncharacterized iron-regulated protein
MQQKISFIFLVFIISANFIWAQKPAYKLFNNKGKETKYDALVKEARNADIILFGELHNNPISHWLQLELITDLYSHSKDLVLGAEMFEADNQLVLDEYLAGKITEKTFKAEAKFWTNYATDYKPLIEFAKKNKIPFIATNVPRRYANLVYNSGVEELNKLDEKALQYLPPLPFKYDPELKSYKEISKATGGHGGENLPKSQALKDATMAHFILKNYTAGKKFIHFNGAYHSNDFEGIYWYLKQENPQLKILTISTVEQDDLNELSKDHAGIADFIILVPESMTKTH